MAVAPWQKYGALAAARQPPWVRYKQQAATPQVQAAADAAKVIPADMGFPLALMNGRQANFTPEFMGAFNALNTGLENVGHQIKGEPMPYGMADAYKAGAAQTRKVIEQYAAQHPVGNVVSQVAGALENPLSQGSGKFVAAARSLPETVARSIAAGGVTGAAYGAGAGGPGNRVGGAVRGGVTGMATGAAVPLGAVGAARAAAAAQGVGRSIARAGGFVPPVTTANDKLASALAADLKAGQNPAANLQAWRGVSQPSLADVAGENVRAVIRDAGTKGPARTALADYERSTNSALQGNAQQLASQLTPNDARPASAIAADVDQRIAQASTPPISAQPGQGGAALSQALNERAAQAKAQVDAAYAAARAASPDQAQLPKDALPGLASSVRDAVSTFPQTRVNQTLDTLDTLNAPTARDLFDLRSRLSNLRMSNDPVEAAAAGRAVSELDNQIDAAHDAGQFTGDPNVVGLWKDANAARRAYGQQFEGGDLIHALTDRDWRGGGMNLVVAPEDASNFILGKSASGVNAKANLSRDFGRVVDLLGNDHPAVEALQNEAASRLLSADAGTPDFGTAYNTFAQNNPAVASTLLPDLNTQLAQQRLLLSQGVADRQALQAGGTVARAAPDTYASSFGDADPSSTPAQIGARQAITDLIGAGPEGATGALNRVGTSPNSGDNLALTFGPDAAGDFRAGLSQEVAKARNADWMAPQQGSKTFSSGQDASHGGGGFHPVALIGSVFKKFASGLPLSDAERGALVSAGTSPINDEALQAYMARLQPSASRYGMLGSSGYLAAPIASAASIPNQ